MFVARRAYSTSSEELFSQSMSRMTNFLKYHETAASLRPLIYRKKNAAQVLAQEMRDPKTKQLLKPQVYENIPTASTLSKCIWNAPADKFGEVASIFYTINNTTVRKPQVTKYLTGKHIADLLLKAKLIGEYPAAAKVAEACKDRFTAETIDALSFVQLRKLNDKNQAQVLERIGKLAQPSLVTAAVYAKAGQSEKAAEIAAKFEPLVAKVPAGVGARAKWYNENKFKYLYAKSVNEYLPRDDLAEFVKAFETVEGELAKPSFYEQFQESV